MPTFDEDLDAIFEDETFSTCAEFALTANSSICVNGHFTDASDAVVLFGNVEIEAQRPTFVCRTSKIADVRNKMSVTIDETDYTVEKISKIGQGSSVVYLKT